MCKLTEPQKPSPAPLDPRYLAFVEAFNRGEFFEAHEVLEPLWLDLRQSSDGLFYKGLIQLAGAFVHVQKKRPLPAVALLSLARDNLEKFEQGHKQLDSTAIRILIDAWRTGLMSPSTQVTQLESPAPQIRLMI